MNKQPECARLAIMLGWVPVCDVDAMRNLGVSDAVKGDCVWLYPKLWKGQTHGRFWVHDLDFDPWEDANDDLLILEHYKSQTSSVISDYKDALYHETKGHGTHNVWDYKKGKFANAAITMLNKSK